MPTGVQHWTVDKVMNYDLETLRQGSRFPSLVSYIWKPALPRCSDPRASCHPGHCPRNRRGQMVPTEMTDSLPKGSRCHTAVGTFTAHPIKVS